MPTLTLTRQTVWKVGEVCRQEFQNDAWTDLESMKFYGICCFSLVTPLSLELMRMYQVIGGIKANTPYEYGQLPAMWCAAVELIEAELRAQPDG